MISINATLVVQIINLLILVFILNRLMYRPLKRIVQERAQAIAGGKAEALGLQERAEQEQADYKRKLNHGRQRARQRLEEARSRAQAEASAVISQAQDKARQQADELRESIRAEMDQARVDIRQQAEQVAVSMASRLLDREVS